MAKKILAFLILFTLYINPAYSQVFEQPTEETLTNTGIKLAPEEKIDSITFSKLKAKYNKRKKHKDSYTSFDSLESAINEDSNFWKNSNSFISTQISELEKPENSAPGSFSFSDIPFYRNSYRLEELQKAEGLKNVNGIPDLKPVEPKWDIPEIEEKSRVTVFNLKASKEKKAKDKESLKSRTWDFIKGEKGDSAILLGMFSHHTSDKDHNETHNLVGIDYKGYTIGTFKNSYSDQTVYAGIHRKIYESYLTKHIKFNINYKLCLMHGYDDHYPNIAGITPIIMPMFGLTLWKLGMDFIAVPDDDPTLIINFRFNLPNKGKTDLKKVE